MKTNNVFILSAALLVSAAVQAKGWRMTIGPAWRSQIKMETYGTVSTSAISAETTRTPYDRDPGAGEWTPDEVVETRPDPSPTAPEGDELWAIGANFIETTVTPNADGSLIDATDSRSALGLKAKVGFDIYESETISVGLDLRFASYWNMRTSAASNGGGATVLTRTGTDWWLFTGGPVPYDRDFEDVSDPERSEVTPTTWTSEETSYISGQTVCTRLRSDLYQIGLGPTVSWHALSWLDAYVSVAALCNIAKLDFEAGDSRTSDTKCALGFAGDIGLAAYLTDNIGLYAEVGYEWVDRIDTSIDALSARVDFSSLVISAGVAFRF